MPSVADQIATWYKLRRSDIERIEFEDSFDRDHFVIRPRRIKFRGRRSLVKVYPDSNPLTLTAAHRSGFLLAQIAALRKQSRQDLAWAASQIARMAEEHSTGSKNVDERDLLRASGALSKLGIHLGMYRAKGIDCPDAAFQFDELPQYPCPVEIEQKSGKFLARHHAAHRKQRVVVLCMEHDEPSVMQGYVDVLELRELAHVLRKSA